MPPTPLERNHGVITEYVRLRPHELAEIQRLLVEDPDAAYEYAGDLRMGDEDEEVTSRGIDTDQSWQGLRFLLIKAGMPIDIVGGGQPITEETWGYDSPRLLTVAEVAESDRFLTRLSFASLAEHYEPAELTKARVSPLIWDKEWALPDLMEAYQRLVNLLHAAASDSEPVLIWLALRPGRCDLSPEPNTIFPGVSGEERDHAVVAVEAGDPTTRVTQGRTQLASGQRPRVLRKRKPTTVHEIEHDLGEVRDQLTLVRVGEI